MQSLVTSSQVQPVTIQQQVQTVQAQRVLTQTANGTLQTLAPATVQTVATPQVQQVPVGGLGRTRGIGGDSELVLGRDLLSMLRSVIKSIHRTGRRAKKETCECHAEIKLSLTYRCPLTCLGKAGAVTVGAYDR